MPKEKGDKKLKKKKGTDDFILGKAPSYVDQFPGDCGGTAPLPLEAFKTKPDKDQKILQQCLEPSEGRLVVCEPWVCGEEGRIPPPPAGAWLPANLPHLPSPA